MFDRNRRGPGQVAPEDEPALPPGCEEQPKLGRGRLPACRASLLLPTNRYGGHAAYMKYTYAVSERAV